MPQDIPELPRTSSEARRPMTPTREVSEDKLETLETLHSEKGKDKVADDDSDSADGKSKTIPFPPLPEHDEDKL
ncbi:hypothetical protein HYQ46_003498 [Verticillium longisporum]|nr:hypothetical protein HYQ46_003498 [Verticillium longisporum]